MHAAMDIGVFAGCQSTHRIEHRRRFLRRCGIVEVHQRLSVHLAFENGKIPPQGRDIVIRNAMDEGLRGHGEARSAAARPASISRHMAS